MKYSFEPPKKFKITKRTENTTVEDNQEPLETEETKPSGSEKKSKKPRIILALLVTVIVLLLLVIAVPAIYAYWFISSFTMAGDTSFSDLYSSVRSGWHEEIVQSQDRVNFLILGLDEIEGQRDGSNLTDTMIIVSYSLEDNVLHLISLPRDLWLDAYKTKINAIYYYGEISEEITGRQFSAAVVEEVTGLPIHHVVPIKLEILSELINILGGVTIEIPATFTDTKFPRADVDIETTSDPGLLYETITFEKGVYEMDGVTALKYIRTRQSDDLDEGTDIARSRRQQQLIKAITQKIQQKEILRDPHKLGSLYKWFQDNLITDSFTLTQAIALSKVNKATVPKIEPVSLPIQAEESDTGLLYHPPTVKYQQWVYEPVDPSWNAVHTYVESVLTQN